ncbi:hypothetical protein [Pseudoclavibacter sp. RFBB5]|uniref:hypothetical protein n=1 Tax=Pseudoclavibacter sp. RFBB5 TaxID=2080574 RepID=UPI000CE8125F|nr:hypothetical protein [Pseudoclavibacter sp. RFBB5]PPG29650.1 hypothetical protein C5B97_11805 [Pseudoclavibacter sp. RFBB5]
MAKQRNQVVATMIVVKVPGAPGGEAYFKKGKYLPSGVPADELKRLKALELVKTVTIDEPAETDEARAAREAAEAEAAAKAAAPPAK